MNDGLEHRVYSESPPEQEHLCEGLQCWCNPYVEEYLGEMVVVHNDIASAGDKRKGH